jgi:hypothetical protein
MMSKEATNTQMSSELLRGRRLIICYAISDCAFTFAIVSLDELLAAME